MARVRQRWLAAVLATFGFATACTDSQSPKAVEDLLPTGAALSLAVTTTGSATDPDGYIARVDVAATQPVGPDGLATFTGLSDGAHRVDLLGVAANCLVSGGYNPRAVSVTAGVAGATRFDMGCSAVGSLFVSTSTTGVDLDADGYTVTVDGSTSQPVGANGNVTFTGLSSYTSHAVAVSSVVGNCTVNGANSQTVPVAAGGMTDVSFSLTCTPLANGTGTLTIVTSTTGSNVDPDGYTLTIDGSSSQPIAANDTVTVTASAGDNPVALSGVAANCAVSGANPRTVTVAAGGADTTTFAVTCGAQPPPQVSGQVQLGWGSATPGNYVETFAFDVRADLTGRFTVTDYGDLHADGTPGSMTTDAATDPQTAIIQYRTSSSACSDPSRGVEFDAWGRANDGDLLYYTVELCDNGPAGSGADFVSLYIPSKGFGRSGSVTSGDVAKQ